MTTSGIENSAPQQQPAGANDQSGTASRKTREALDGSAESPGQPSRESAKVSIQSELGAVVRRVLASMPGKSSQSINLAAVKSQAREIVNEMSRQPGASPSKIRQLHAAIDQLERGDIERILDEGAQAKGEGPEVSDEDADSSGVVRTQDNTNNVVRISNSKTMYISSGAGSHDTYKFSASALQEGDVKVVYGTGADSKVHLPNDIEIVDSYFLTGKDQSNRWFRVVYKDATGSERRIDIEAPAGFKTESVVKENGESLNLNISAHRTTEVNVPPERSQFDHHQTSRGEEAEKQTGSPVQKEEKKTGNSESSAQENYDKNDYNDWQKFRRTTVGKLFGMI